MKLLLCALALFSTACGKSTIWVHPELQPYVNSFLQEGNKRSIPVYIENLIATFGVMEDDTWGTCHFNNDVPYITISADAWHGIVETSKEILMYHELGHCLLGRNHRNDKDMAGINVSIMGEYALQYRHYEARRDDFVNELFTGTQ